MPLYYSVEMSAAASDTLRLNAGRVLPLLVNGNTSLILSAQDSILLRYMPDDETYSIAGGKYAVASYAAYERIKSLTPPYQVYNEEIDNFEMYRDSLLFHEEQRNVLLKQIDGDALAQDVRNYLTTYINYSKLFALLMRLNAKTMHRFEELSAAGLVSKGQFNSDEWSYMDMYQLASLSYCTLTNQGAVNDVSATINNAIDNSSGITRDNLLVMLYSNQFALRELEESELKKIYERSLTLAGNDRAKSILARNYHLLTIQGKGIPAGVAEQTMLQALDGGVLTLADFIQQVKGKKVLIDFWASWCGPCIAGLPTVKKIEEQHVDNSDYAVIYISLDEKEGAWRASAEKHNISKNQLLLVDNFESALAKYLQITSIPRYVIIGEDSRVKDFDSSLHRLANGMVDF